MARRRLFTPHPAGLDPAKSAPFWQGKRAIGIVRRRVKQYLAEKRAKEAAKRQRSTR